MTGSRFYRILLRLFPPDVRERYGAEMEATFLHILEVEGRGRASRAWVRTRAVGDALLRGLGMRFRRRWAGGRTGSAADRRADGFRGPRGRREGGYVMGSMGSDIRFALRAMIRRPLFTFTAVATLALGIGATTAVFSLVNGLLVRSLPYPEADRLVRLYAEHHERGWTETDVNAADAWDWRERSGVFEDLAIFDEVGLNFTGGDVPELVVAVAGTPGLLGTVLGVEPVLGRDFGSGDARPGAPLVVILAHGFWERRFGSDPSVLGREIVLDDEPATVVGVMPADFVFPDERPEIYVPLRFDPALASRGDHDMEALGRLAPGVELARAQEAVSQVAARLEAEHPEQNEGWTVRVMGLRDDLLGDMAKQAALVLLGAVGFVLLMACTNVANLLLARASSRRAELSIRRALGAGRGRILRQLLVESGVLAVAGGATGLALGWAGHHALLAGLPPGMPPAFQHGIDGTVLAFAAAITVGSVLLFGLVPAFRASGTAAGELREGGRNATGTARGRRFGSFLVVVQTALAVVLLVGGGVMIRSVAGLVQQDMGFEADDVLTVRMSPPERRYSGDEALERFWEDVLSRVRALPGVQSAGAVQSLPLGGSNWGGSVWLEGREDPQVDPGRSVRFGYVTPGYFRTLGIEVVRGREVSATDGDGPGVALVNERFVERAGLPGDVLGTVLLSTGSREPVRVVGVVEDHIERSIDRPAEAAVYHLANGSGVRARTLVIRTTGDPGSFVDAVQAAVWTVDPDQPVYEIRTMDGWIDQSVGGFRILAQVMGVFGLVSLLLGAVGIYGVTAYGVGRRTAEIGVRMAMGADRRRVVAMVLGEVLRRAVIGLVLGAGLALALSRTMASLLVGVSPHDPLTFGSVIGLLLAVLFLGSVIPARRASGVDPVRALAAE